MGTRPPSSLLYVAPKVSASATVAYHAMPSRTYCISCSQSHRPGFPEGYPWPSLFSRPVFGISIFGYYVLPLFDRDDGRGRRGFLILFCSENYRDVLTRLSTALAMTEAAYLEARRRRDL